MKRLLSLALALVMVLSAVPATVFATEATPTLPTAKVSEITKDDLTFAMNFRVNSVTEEQLTYYGNWYADFELTVNKEVTFNNDGSADGWLAGQYDEWSYDWVTVPFGKFAPVTLEANETMKIMAFAAECLDEPGLKYTFREVYETVKDFNCGVFFDDEFLLANPDLVVTLELKMYNPENESENYVIGETYTYYNPIVAMNTATNKAYSTVMDAMLDCAEDQTVALLKDVNEAMVSVFGDTTLDLNGHALNAGYVSCFGDIIDSSADNSGLLVVPASRFMIREDNAQMPVHNGNGYRFVEVLRIDTVYLEAESKFCFQPRIEPSMLALLKQGSAVTGITIQVEVSWKQGNGYRTQNFVYNDSYVQQYLNSYKPATDKYSQMFTLTLNGAESFEELTFTATVVSDTKVSFSSDPLQNQKPAGNVTTDANNQVVNDVNIGDSNASALVPSGTQLESGANNVTLSATEMERTTSNITLDDGEQMVSMNVHVAGVSANNTKPIIVTLNKLAPEALNQGNLKLYHVENGETVEMTRVYDLAEVDAHNEYYYDIATGDVTMALATFSEIAVVSDTAKAWGGSVDHSWYVDKSAPYYIANADQLWSFSQIVGGMAKKEDGAAIAQHSFAGETVILLADINLADAEDSNDEAKIFYPIGYNSDDGKYGKTGVAVSTGFYTFKGTFDGNGHTISNFYQNTWEMKGDNNYYDVALQYYRDGMGLFGKIYRGTVKNLTVKNFSSDGEYTTTGVIAAYADGATFENIAIFDCNPRVYNIGNGGIVGCVGWYAKDAGLQTTFTNITVDNSNKISALWGSYDVACGGILGQYYPTSGQSSANYPVNAGVHFKNCHVSAQMDVYNDVCANYQYYAYRYAGILLGSVRENVTIDGHSYPKMDGITAENCTVHFGDWNDYYYCELVANSLASYTHDHQMSRLEQVLSVDVKNMTVTTLNGDEKAIPAEGRVNYVVVKAKDAEGMWIHGDGSAYATCYHFVNGAIWNHAEAGTETVDGETVLKEDKQLVYREFNNLVTGYGWGVTSKGVEDMDGVEILDREDGSSVVKFEGKVTELYNNTVIKLSDIFAFVDNDVALVPDALTVAVTNLDESNPVSAEFKRDEDNWENGTILFTGKGTVELTIQDYYFCTPTTITVEIKGKEAVQKFETKFTGDFLYRVGNQNTVSLNSLFKAKEGVEIGTVDVIVETIYGADGDYTSNATWTDGTIQFSGTGVVKVTITDNDYCTPTELILEVVDATNVTGVSGILSGNVVLLNNASLNSVTVSGRNTLYGNGFTLTYTGNGQYLRNGLKLGVVTVSENGTLDNVRIVASIYPSAYMYYGSTMLGDYVQGGPSDGNERYYYQLSAVAASGNATISNCYIYGGRNNIFVNTGDVTITDTILECGTVANVQIQSNASHTVTFNNVTTIQYQVNPTIDDTSKVMLGAGILVGPETNDNPTIVLNGDFKQYNWVTADDADAVSDTKVTKAIIQSALDATDYNHTVGGKTASNLGIIYMNTYDATVTNNTGLPYVLDTVKMEALGNTADGQVCSLQNATAEQIYSDYVNADKTTENGWYEPQFKYSADLGGQLNISDNDDTDNEHCYREGDTIHVMFPSGDTKELNLAALVNITKYTGQDLNLEITCKDSSGNAVTVTDGKISLSAIEEYTVTYTVTDTVFYDKDGNQVGSGDARAVTVADKRYSWDVTISVSLKDTAVPDAYFEFNSNSQKMGYEKQTVLFDTKIYQYLPFLAGLQIYDYNGQTPYLRFNGDEDFDKVASIELTNKVNDTNYALVKVTLTDGGIIETKFYARANSSGNSGYTGTIKTNANTIYFVCDKETSESDKTTTTAYWYVEYYKFTGNNGVTIQSAQQTFNSTGSSATKPSTNFGTTIKYTVTFDANGGNCGQAVGYATSAAAAVTLPTPIRSGYMFLGWFTAASGGTPVGGAGDSYIPSADITLYAQWGKPSTVTYNANGGSVDTTSEKYTGTALTLPMPTRDGYWFVGWYDAAEGGKKIGDAGTAYQATGDITLYAHWQEAVEYTVIYNANGGSCGTASATYQGTALTLPTPTKEGYTFNGWYTAESGGSNVDGDGDGKYIPSANVTLYAQWTINSYKITISTNGASVTVTVDGTAVASGDKIPYGKEAIISVTFTGRDKYSLTVTDASGNNVIEKKTTNGDYAFKMPASDVTITAYSECVTADTLITLADGSQVRVDSLSGGEELLVWNLETGKLDSAPILFIDSDPEAAFEIVHLYFSDGTDVKVIYEHGFWDYDLNKYVYLDRYAAKYIGHTFAKHSGEELSRVQLTDVVIETEVTTAWSPVTAGHLCYFVNGMLSMPGGVGGLFNIFQVDPDTMTYDPEAMQRDIETYGLFTYEEMNAIVPLPKEMFETCGGAYLKVSIGKGNMTLDDLIYMIERYTKFFPG